MIAQTPNCFRNQKKGRDPLCSAGAVVSLVSFVSTTSTWGKITSRRMPPMSELRELAARHRLTVAAIRGLWEKGVIR